MEALTKNNPRDHKLGEQEIIKRILAGEKELYEILVKRNNQKLYRIIRSYITDEAEIEDIMQDTYIKGFTKMYQFKLESTFSTWLIRIGINESLAHIRKKGKLFRLNDYLQKSNSTLMLDLEDRKQLNPYEKMTRRESAQLFEDAVDSLDSKYKIVYIMREVEEMSIKEIADALTLTVSNVKVRLHRSKEMLKEKLLEKSKDVGIFEFGYGRCDRITEKVMKSI
jgi:RNA polymerase sigma-70 factor (ECF subfamily)